MGASRYIYIYAYAQIGNIHFLIIYLLTKHLFIYCLICAGLYVGHEEVTNKPCSENSKTLQPNWLSSG